MEDFEYRFPRWVKFRLGFSTITGLAEPLDRAYPWVFKATLVEGAWHRVVRLWLPSLPTLLQRCIRILWPRYALPSCVVVKKLRGPFVDDGEIVSKTEEFDNEKTMYRRLRSVQGCAVPVFYGEAQCEGRRTLVLSMLAGQTLRNQTQPHLTVEEFTACIEAPIRALQQHGLIYSDNKLSNIMLVDGRIMLVDLEWVEALEPEELDAYCSKVTIRSFIRRYREYLASADYGAVT
ncbi:hypothetical protein HMPREF1624_01685 [Sporothrix schenckii ATCC 58251]|uniref:Protein kinase domain-containing protein n=1 Tax=Sporothrix schenckii (strain ATCC 58251 / de Perez 2211183) TaxID=1391915 RepID=U7Q9B8_SPOS1|nr:hypothetical protein HMPREF1624_01685 [Sporothrix schenckii ATCC 58251]